MRPRGQAGFLTFFHTAMSFSPRLSLFLPVRFRRLLNQPLYPLLRIGKSMPPERTGCLIAFLLCIPAGFLQPPLFLLQPQIFLQHIVSIVKKEIIFAPVGLRRE